MRLLWELIPMEILTVSCVSAGFLTVGIYVWVK